MGVAGKSHKALDDQGQEIPRCCCLPFPAPPSPAGQLAPCPAHAQCQGGRLRPRAELWEQHCELAEGRSLRRGLEGECLKVPASGTSPGI